MSAEDQKAKRATIFSQEDIHALHGSLISASITPLGLIAELDPEVQAILTNTAPTHADLTLSILTNLNRLRLLDGSVPFRTVLRTACLLAGPKAEREAFERALRAMDEQFPDIRASSTVPATKDVPALTAKTRRRLVFFITVGVIAGALLATVIVLMVTRKKGNRPVPSIATVVEVDDLPEATSCGQSGICTLRDIMTWDLRATVPVGDSEKKLRQISPARFINYLHLVRRRDQEGTYRAHYSTSGFGIDFNVVTHNLIDGAVKKKRHTNARHDADSHEQYALEIDISQEPLGREFLVIVEGVYWNGFRLRTESAETYSDDELLANGELAILVVFPQQYPPRNVTRLEFSDQNEQDKGSPYRGLEVFPDGQGRYLYWSIRQHRAGYHYQLRWDWDLADAEHAK